MIATCDATVAVHLGCFSADELGMQDYIDIVNCKHMQGCEESRRDRRSKARTVGLGFSRSLPQKASAHLVGEFFFIPAFPDKVWLADYTVACGTGWPKFYKFIGGMSLRVCLSV